MRCAAVVLALVIAGSASAASPQPGGASYLLSRRQPDGGFAEPGRSSDPALTAWAVLALAAAGREAPGAAEYLAGKPYRGAIDLALRILALRALGRRSTPLLETLESLRGADGRLGRLVNSTVWGVLALRAFARPVGRATVRYLLRRQSRSGGWSWAAGVAPDSNDTAAAVQALRAAGVSARSRSIRRGLAYLRGLQNRDGGFALVHGRASDAQSTAWAIQAFLAARRRPGRRAYAYLMALQQRDGSFRYSSRYAVTPVWVTSQVLPALARRPFPL
jgi:hypothetical protein